MKYKFCLKLLVFSVLSLGLCKSYAQVETAGSAVWQYSIDVKYAQGSSLGVPRAYMWIPPNCTKVRGLVLGQNNMMEFSIMENQSFRDSMASIGFGVLWVSPRYDFAYNPQEGAKELFLQMMTDLVAVSGFKELYYVPIVPIGHSAFANFPFTFMAATPDRALCGISNDGIFPYDYNNQVGINYQCGKTIDYVPIMTVVPEQEGGGQWLSNNSNFYKRANHPYTPMTHLPAGGEWHFASTERRAAFQAYYIKKIAAIRLIKDATDTSLAVLKPIDPTTMGWLYDRWRVNMKPRYPAAPVQSYTGKKSIIGSAAEENWWCVDEEMAKKIEEYENINFRKKPVLTAYNQTSTQGVVGPQVQQFDTHLQNHLSFYPLNDSLDFELSASFLDTVPAVSGRMRNWVFTTDTITGNWTNSKPGDKVTHPTSASSINISREIGPISKIKTDSTTGITTFRMTMERGIEAVFNNGYTQSFTMGMIYPGDATYRQFSLQAQIFMSLKNTIGLAQSITFDQLPNVKADASTIPLSATSSLGMPVQYYVKEGPVVVSGSNLIIKDFPTRATSPVKVTVVAWQWGRDAGLANRTTGKSVPYAGQQIQSATPVENTFYINPIVTPVKLASFDAKLIGAKVELAWKTTSEINAASYEIEISNDGLQWATLTEVSAKGKPSSYKSYDNTPKDGVNYYRLKMRDKDDSYQYSKVVSVYIKIDGLNIVKAGSLVNISGGRPNSRIAVTIYNSIGQLVQTSQQVIPSTKIVTTHLNNLAAGVYIIHAASDEFVKNLKVVVNN